MPCYTVQKISVKFKAKHIDVLEEACARLGLTFKEEGRYSNIGLGLIVVDKVSEEATSRFSSDINLLKRTYSEVAIEKVAAKKNWLLKKTNKNQMQLKRF